MKTEQNNAILAEICKLARELPSGQRDAIVNKCNRIRHIGQKELCFLLEHGGCRLSANKDPADILGLAVKRQADAHIG